MLQHLIDTKHQLAMCWHAKAGCSTLKRQMISLLPNYNVTHDTSKAPPEKFDPHGLAPKLYSPKNQLDREEWVHLKQSILKAHAGGVAIQSLLGLHFSSHLYMQSQLLLYKMVHY